MSEEEEAAYEDPTRISIKPQPKNLIENDSSLLMTHKDRRAMAGKRMNRKLGKAKTMLGAEYEPYMTPH